MLEIKDLHVAVDGKEILKGLSLSVQAGQVHAIMGPNGSGKSTLSYVLAGRDGYEITSGSITYKGEDLTAMKPEERAAKGIFLALQYPVEIPGVPTLTFLKTALNSQRRARGESEIDALGMLKLVREKAKALGVKEEMLKRALNVGFSNNPPADVIEYPDSGKIAARAGATGIDFKDHTLFARGRLTPAEYWDG
ncbi:MAG: ATP-binding cassette domain-containing protein, partial [Alphaproteobacteria bacterium]|nr:ATP-binding cassette domain-containing protein [Alphaproteobacteria bacterium]